MSTGNRASGVQFACPSTLACCCPATARTRGTRATTFSALATSPVAQAAVKRRGTSTEQRGHGGHALAACPGLGCCCISLPRDGRFLRVASTHCDLARAESTNQAKWKGPSGESGNAATDRRTRQHTTAILAPAPHLPAREHAKKSALARARLPACTCARSGGENRQRDRAAQHWHTRVHAWHHTPDNISGSARLHKPAALLLRPARHRHALPRHHLYLNRESRRQGDGLAVKPAEICTSQNELKPRFVPRAPARNCAASSSRRESAAREGALWTTGAGVRVLIAGGDHGVLGPESMGPTAGGLRCECIRASTGIVSHAR